MNTVLAILNRDSTELRLDNFVIMPPASKVTELGFNILHINTKTRPYTDNSSAIKFIEKIKEENPLVKEFSSDSSALRFAVETAVINNTEGYFSNLVFILAPQLILLLPWLMTKKYLVLIH